MEENQIYASVDTPAEKTERAKQNWLRTIVMVFLQISNVAFCTMMGYLLVTFLLNHLGVDLGALFGYEGMDLGFMETLGIFAIALIVGIAALIVSVAVGFVASNQKYYNVLKTAKQENLKVALAPKQTIASSIWMVLALIIMGFVCMYFAQNSIVSLTSILLYISIAALGTAFVFTIAICITNRVMYGKLSDEEKEEVKEISKQFKIKMEKRERNKRAGKLY